MGTAFCLFIEPFQLFWRLARGISFAYLREWQSPRIHSGVSLLNENDEGRKHMEMKSESRISYLLVGIGLGAIGGLVVALLARKEAREKVLERGSKSLNYLKEQGQRLRESSKEAAKKGRNLIGRQCHESVESSAEGERQAYEEERREGAGG
jgi:gas vesicle protein